MRLSLRISTELCCFLNGRLGWLAVCFLKMIKGLDRLQNLLVLGGIAARLGVALLKHVLIKLGAERRLENILLVFELLEDFAQALSVLVE